MESISGGDEVMNDIRKLIRKIEVKMKSKQGEKLKNWVRKNKKKIRKIEKDTFSLLLSQIGLGDKIDMDKLHIELANIQLKENPELLIKGVEESAEAFKKIHQKAEKEAKQYNDMVKELGISGAKALLPFIISIF